MSKRRRRAQEPQGGHRDAAEILHEELTHLFNALGVDLSEVADDLDLWTHFVKENSEDKLLTFMRTEFARGYLAAIALASLDATVEAARNEERETGDDDEELSD